jgi:hypothetical protein
MTDATGRLAVTAGRDGEQRLRVARATAPEGVAVVPVGSTGVSALEPLALATRDGRTAIHATADAERCAEIAGAFDGGRPHLHAHAVVEHQPGTDRLPTPEQGPLSVGRGRRGGRRRGGDRRLRSGEWALSKPSKPDSIGVTETDDKLSRAIPTVSIRRQCSHGSLRYHLGKLRQYSHGHATPLIDSTREKYWFNSSHDPMVVGDFGPLCRYGSCRDSPGTLR